MQVQIVGTVWCLGYFYEVFTMKIIMKRISFCSGFSFLTASVQQLRKILLLSSSLLLGLGASSITSAEITFTPQQVSNGAAIYQQHCQVCHGSNLSNGQFAPPIKGAFFQRRWQGKSLGELARLTYEQMPPGGGRSLRVQDYIASIAFILEGNDFEAGTEVMSDDFNVLDEIMFPW